MEDASDYQTWFERTFQAREQELDRLFGTSHPPGSPEGYVLAHSLCGSGDHEVLIPGACSHIYPPKPLPIHETQLSRKNWFYATVGLSQPGDPKDKPWDGIRGNKLSAYGLEFLMIVPGPREWVGTLLRELMGYCAKASRLYEGHRMPFGLYESTDGEISWFIGKPEELGVKAVGSMRALVFWPFLAASRWLTTGTGNFELLCATAITGDEWQFAKDTSSAHLLLLLCRAGIGQCSLVERNSVFDDPALSESAEKLRALGHDAAISSLRDLREHEWL